MKAISNRQIFHSSNGLVEVTAQPRKSTSVNCFLMSNSVINDNNNNNNVYFNILLWYKYIYMDEWPILSSD